MRPSLSLVLPLYLLGSLQSAAAQDAPVQTAPVQPPPAQAAPLETAPVEPAPGKAPPLEPAPVQPAPVYMAPVQPAPVYTPPPVYEEPSARDIVIAYNTGFRLSIAPGIFIPTNGGDVGFSIAADGRYGFELGPTVLAPGLRLAGYFPDGVNILVAMATTRLTIPVGPVGPFIVGGVGPGYVSDPSETGLAYLGGGGFMVHFGARFGLGAEATYQGITGTDFAALFIGPSILLAF